MPLPSTSLRNQDTLVAVASMNRESHQGIPWDFKWSYLGTPSAAGRRVRRRWLVLVLVAGCADNGDVTGPFTGTPRRYVVDSITLPARNAKSHELGADLNGDQTVDNQLGAVISTLSSWGNITTHGDDMLASGALASSFVIVANNGTDDPTVSVTYYGSEGAPATHVGGTLEDGVFVSNRTATTQVPGAAVARLPIFVDVDPVDVPMFGLQMTLTPDERGFDAAISGAIDRADAISATHAAFVAQVAADPMSHRELLSIMDRDGDYAITYDEVATNSLIVSWFAPDVVIGGRQGLSLGYHVHISPCDEGTCVASPPDDTCFDRVKDGAESDVDCSGGCRSCKASETCTTGADCETGACDAGSCRAPTCNDSLRDGFEWGVDCGGTCGSCAVVARVSPDRLREWSVR